MRIHIKGAVSGGGEIQKHIQEAEADCLHLYRLCNATNAENTLCDAQNVPTKYSYTTKSEHVHIHV